MVSLKSYSKFISLFILIGLFLIIVLPINAHFLEESDEAVRAEEAAARLPEVSLLPDSFFYFLKTSKEAIQGFFIFNIESKMKFKMNLANKRLAELVDLVHKNQEPYMEEALEREGEVLFQIVGLMIKAQEEDINILDLKEKHKQLLDDHEIILLNIEDDVPETAKSAYRHILDVIDQNRDHMKQESEHEE